MGAGEDSGRGGQGKSALILKMFAIEISQLFSLVLTASMVAAGSITLAGSIRERRCERELKQNTFHCRVCGRSYLRPGAGKLQKCPDCASSNLTGPDRRLG